MGKKSKLTFKDLACFLLFVKVYWNDELIYDDTAEPNESLLNYDYLILHYGEKIVYSMKVDVVDYHHCVLHVKGE